MPFLTKNLNNITRIIIVLIVKFNINVIMLKTHGIVEIYNEKTLSATDVLAPISMKNAAKCDT